VKTRQRARHLACWEASRDPAFRVASRAWFAHGLALRRPGEGVGGFVSFAPRDSSWVASRTLLEGAAGIALAFVAGLGGDEPGWDRLLACDIPCLGPTM